jgi:hypothetical protein
MSIPLPNYASSISADMAAAGAAALCCRQRAEPSATSRPPTARVRHDRLRNQGWAITEKTFKFADFAPLRRRSKVLGGNVDETKRDRQAARRLQGLSQDP